MNLFDSFQRGVHYFFQEDWLRESTNAESYLMDHDIARRRLIGVDSFEALIKPWSKMSLKDQGWLDKPSCPMLILNGKDDLQTPHRRSLCIVEIRRAQVGAGFHRRAHGSIAGDVSIDRQSVEE